MFQWTEEEHEQKRIAFFWLLENTLDISPDAKQHLHQLARLEKEQETENNPFLTGPIFRPLLKFMIPVLLANLLQAMYSAVDLMVIGRYANAETVQLANAAVGTGSMIMVMVTFVINGLAMGTTVVLG